MIFNYFHITNKQFTDTEEQIPIPHIVIWQNEDKQEKQGLVEAEPMGNNAQFVDGFEVKVEAESKLNGKSKFIIEFTYQACKLTP